MYLVLRYFLACSNVRCACVELNRTAEQFGKTGKRRRSRQDYQALAGTKAANPKRRRSRSRSRERDVARPSANGHASMRASAQTSAAPEVITATTVTTTTTSANAQQTAPLEEPSGVRSANAAATTPMTATTSTTTQHDPNPTAMDYHEPQINALRSADQMVIVQPESDPRAGLVRGTWCVVSSSPPAVYQTRNMWRSSRSNLRLFPGIKFRPIQCATAATTAANIACRTPCRQ